MLRAETSGKGPGARGCILVIILSRPLDVFSYADLAKWELTAAAGLSGSSLGEVSSDTLCGECFIKGKRRIHFDRDVPSTILR